MCDRNTKSECILVKLLALVFECICERNTEFHEKILFDRGVINLQTQMTKYCSHLSGSDVILWEPVWCCRDRWLVWVAVSSLGHTNWFFIDQGTKVNGQYYWDGWLHQQLLPAIRDLSGIFFSTGQCSCPHGAWDHAAVNLWHTRFHRSSSVARQQSWPKLSRLPDLGEPSQPDSWRWPAEVTPDRRVGIFLPGVHRWSDQAVASMSSSLHSSTRRTF